MQPLAALGPTTPFAVAAVFLGLGYAGVAYWLYHDARAHGSTRPGAWVVNWFLFTVAALAYYLLIRGRIGERTVPVTTVQQAGLTVSAAVGLSLLATAFGPPDPVTQLRIFAPSLLVTLPLAYGLLVAAAHLRTRPGVAK